MKKIVLFDLDGTILNTLDDLHDSLNHSLLENNLPTRSYEETRCFVGNGIFKLIERATGLADQSIIEKVFNDFNDYYKDHCMDKTVAYDGIVDLLKTLKEKNIKTAVVSNKSQYAVDILINYYFENLFDEVIGVTEKLKKKPSSDMCDYVLNKLDIDNKEAIYVGDSDVDIQTAINCKMDYIIVSYGFRKKEELSQANIIVDNVEQLKKKILSTINN